MAKTVDLNSLCSDVIDCPHSTPVWQNEGVYVVRNFNIKHGELDFSEASYVDEETYKTRTQRAVPEEGDLIISREAPMGDVCIIPHGIKCCLGQRVVLLKVNKDICNPSFLVFAILSDYVQKQISVVDKTGSIVSNLNIPDLKSLNIPSFSKPEQDSIASVLSSITKKIRLNNQTITLLERTAKLLYDYWFVQFDFPNAEGKPYRTSGGEMVYDEQLMRDVPKGWKYKSIEDCTEQIRTGLNPRQNFVLGKGSNRYITIKNIENGSIDFSKCDYVDDDAIFKIHRRSAISVGDILFTSIEPVGRLYRIWEQPQDWDINESVFSIRTATDVVSTDYLYATMNSDYFRATSFTLKTGSVQKGIRIGDLQSIRIALPPDPIMEQFSEKVQPLYQKMWRVEKENAELTALRDFLLPLLMNGQVRVCKRG